jgi:hypothetical protein
MRVDAPITENILFWLKIKENIFENVDVCAFDLP